MKLYYEPGDRVQFKRMSDQDWRTGVVVLGWLDTVHIYGDDMVTNRYKIKVDGSGEVVEACILWDSVERENLLEELARI
jgi:hypothetical protein